ncbi:MAG: hypothetical protein M1812_001254 [Candelaria pacifica]|nr:MAG: hypothetical protein M1812_001254 [Candelaria pacifica]
MEPDSSDIDLQSDSPTISWPLNRPSERGSWNPSTDHHKTTAPDSILKQPFLYADNLPGQPKSLSGISLRAYLLGNVTGISTLFSLYLLNRGNGLWRAPFFLASLSIFHNLEFWTTAAYNTRFANVGAFLLSRNGSAYNAAHTGALTECIITNLFFPNRALLPPSLHNPLIGFGLVMLIIGQATRSIAMAQAGTNFNHSIQMKKSKEHELVTSGIYAYLRHPSYFGFFWWGLGTQVVMGNVVGFIAYAGVLWMFFNRRIQKEEQLLVNFFGDEYVKYRQRTRVGIPFIA